MYYVFSTLLYYQQNVLPGWYFCISIFKKYRKYDSIIIYSLTVDEKYKYSVISKDYLVIIKVKKYRLFLNNCWQNRLSLVRLSFNHTQGLFYRHQNESLLQKYFYQWPIITSAQSTNLWPMFKNTNPVLCFRTRHRSAHGSKGHYRTWIRINSEPNKMGFFSRIQTQGGDNLYIRSQ